MKKKTAVSVLVLLIFIGLASFSSGQKLSAKEIVKKSNDKNLGKTSQGTMSMTIVRPKWKRTVKMKHWSKGEKYYMILITGPAKDKGQVFLKRDTEMWQWIPSIERLIKIPPSMMMQSWMGSDFSNDELVKQSSIVDDYTHKIVGRDTLNGFECHKILLTPLPDAPVVWDNVILWISKEGYHMLRAKYYDEDGKLIHTMNASEVKKMGDRYIPTMMEIIPARKKGHKTILTIENSVFNKPIAEEFFSQQNMKTVR